MNIMNICVTVNSKYMRYLYVMLLSLYENNRESHICLYVLQSDFTEQDKKAIKNLSERYHQQVIYIQVDKKKFDCFPRNFADKSTLSLEIYFRLLIPELIPESVDRILMLDVDVIINHNIRELYVMNMQDKCMGAAPNMCSNFVVASEFREWYPSDRTNWTHYNVGVLLWNLKKIREKYPTEYLFNTVFRHKIDTPTLEEELINVEFGENEIVAFDSFKWNYIVTRETKFANPIFKIYQSFEELKKNCTIIHYAGMNPWAAGSKCIGFALWWDWAERTPYYQEFLKEQLKRSEEYIKEKEKEYARRQKENSDREKEYARRQKENSDREIKTRNEKARILASLKEKDIDVQILSTMLTLMRKSEIDQIFENMDEKYYFYGTGEMAERLYAIFNSANCTDRIRGVIDGKKNGFFHGMEIMNIERAVENLISKSIIIVTPLRGQDELVSQISRIVKQNVHVMGLKEYLDILTNLSDA